MLMPKKIYDIYEEYDKTGILLVGKEKISISLDKAIIKKLKQKQANISEFINKLLKNKLHCNKPKAL